MCMVIVGSVPTPIRLDAVSWADNAYSAQLGRRLCWAAAEATCMVMVLEMSLSARCSFAWLTLMERSENKELVGSSSIF
jgi:hypothetical protein